MAEDTLTLAINEVTDLYMQAIDDYIKTELEPMLDSLGNPEKLIGRTWDTWTDQDKQTLVQIYGQPLIEKFIAKKAIEQMYTAEAEVK